MSTSAAMAEAVERVAVHLYRGRVSWANLPHVRRVFHLVEARRLIEDCALVPAPPEPGRSDGKSAGEVRALNTMETYNGEVQALVRIALFRSRSPQVRRAMRRLLPRIWGAWRRTWDRASASESTSGSESPR